MKAFLGIELTIETCSLQRYEQLSVCCNHARENVWRQEKTLRNDVMLAHIFAEYQMLMSFKKIL
ncbi:CLUMA_CG021654, isoform A [Clunio marinus]|uniref:CLUMA_CG021654, isoform A n=1 Tax=Clunio marinus TaxID=568069 RepID=A0A1J1JC46_9DIPT|nr:CLUMA_CG021654, isoform A [Clunio marinus]